MRTARAIGAAVMLWIAVPASGLAADDYLLLTTKFVKASDVKTALATIEKAEKAGQKTGKLSLLKFELLLSLNRADEALAEARSLAASAPDEPGPQENIGRALRQLGKDDVALKHYDEQLRRWPDNDYFNAGRAMALVATGRAEEMVRFEEALLDRYGGGKASARLHIRNINEFIRSRSAPERGRINAALERLPDSAVAHFLKGNLAQGQASLDEMDAALRLRPDFVDELLIRGTQYRTSRQLEKAKVDLDKMIELSPDDARGYAERAWVFQFDGKLSDSLRDLNSAVRLQPDLAYYVSRRCRFLAQYGTNLDRGLQDCDQALAMDAALSDAWAARGLLHLRKSQFDEARRDYDLSLERWPTSPEGLYGRGLARLKAGDVAGGQADIASGIAQWSKVGEQFSDLGLKP